MYMYMCVLCIPAHNSNTNAHIGAQCTQIQQHETRYAVHSSGLHATQPSRGQGLRCAQPQHWGLRNLHNLRGCGCDGVQWYTSDPVDLVTRWILSHPPPPRYPADGECGRKCGCVQCKPCGNSAGR
uniref:Uncharacterized protein n=1 Tax=Lygus hesperus TaxID=30085 RepID=A0A146LVW1_LYGHE